MSTRAAKKPKQEDIQAALDQVHKFFPGSGPSSHIHAEVERVLSADGFTPENTLFACSVCVDEINHEDDDITCLLKSFWGECFYLGGLAGVPFVGKTGFSAFSHHCPEDGNLFVLFAPHVGIAPNGSIGKYARAGQSDLDNACGAAVGAFKAVEAGQAAAAPGAEDYLDSQFVWIRGQLAAHKDKILAAEDKQAAIAQCMFQIVKDFVEKITHAPKKGRLVILGGIQINMPQPSEDFFQPLLFEIHDKDGKVTDILPQMKAHERVKKPAEKKAEPKAKATPKKKKAEEAPTAASDAAAEPKAKVTPKKKAAAAPEAVAEPKAKRTRK
eukprot:m.245222 g.245222  ORF g.245222 m.245222 type:complete len:327 (-) comp14632_c0_seq1:41-1021(-)